MSRVSDIVHPLGGYIQLMWAAMEKTGKGYRQHSLRHTGVGKDRRRDKLDEPMPKHFRAYRARYGA